MRQRLPDHRVKGCGAETVSATPLYEGLLRPGTVRGGSGRECGGKLEEVQGVMEGAGLLSACFQCYGMSERQMNVNGSGTGRNRIDPDGAPELSEDWFNRAEIRIGERVVRRGLPAGSTKQRRSL